MSFSNNSFNSFCNVLNAALKFASNEVDYGAELRMLIPELKEAKVHTVIFPDEFAEVISFDFNYRLHLNKVRKK